MNAATATAEMGWSRVRPAPMADRLWAFGLFALMAISCFVKNEPAPYDLVLVAGYGLFFLSGARVPAGLAAPALCVLLLLTGYAIGALFATYQEDALLSLRTSAFLGVSFLFFAAVIWRAPARMVPAMMAGLVVASTLASILAILGYFAAIPNAEAYAIWGRATGPFEDPNVFAPSLILPILYLVDRISTRPIREMSWSLPLFLVMLLALFLSFSRGAWLNLALSGFVYLVLVYPRAVGGQRTRIAILIFALAGCASLAVAWALSMPEIREQFFQRFALAQEYDVGTGGRFESMSAAFWLALQNPLGIGLFQWPHIWGLMPHNVYVNVFISGGLMSVVGFLALTFLTLRAGLTALKRSSPFRSVLIVALAAFVGHVLQGLAIDSNHWRHLYIMMGLIWGLFLVAKAYGQEHASSDSVSIPCGRHPGSRV